MATCAECGYAAAGSFRFCHECGAVALGAETDMLNAHGDALLDLAEVLALAGQDARAELDQALALYERKGNLVMAEHPRSRLAVSIQ